MFTCPHCTADRSRVLPVDPCPKCGAMLLAPALTPAPTPAPTIDPPASFSEPPPSRAESIDDSFDPDATLAEPGQMSQDALAKIFPSTLATLSGLKDQQMPAKSTPAPLPKFSAAPAAPTTPLASPVDPDELPTEALAPLTTQPLSPAPAPVAAAVAQTVAAPSPGTVKPPLPRAGAPSVPPPTPVSATSRPPLATSPSPPLPPSAPVPAGDASSHSGAAPPLIADAAKARPPEPEYAVTNVESVLGSSFANERAESLPGVPAETPPPPQASPSPPLPAFATAAASRSDFSITHTSSPFEDRPGGDSGVFTKTLMAGEPSVAAAGGPNFARAESPDVFTRTVADAHVVLPPPPVASPPPRTGQGRPSDVLPRAPASAIVQPVAPSGQASSSSSISVMPPVYGFDRPDSAPQQYQRAVTPPPQGYQPTPPPLGGYGPPPAFNDGSYPMAALDSLGSDPSRPEMANAVWRQAHPSATRWAAKRNGSVAITPRPGIIALGLMLVGLGAYLLLIFLPSKAPLTAAGKEQLQHQAGVDELAWHFTAKLMGVATVNAGFFVLLGVVVLLQGALHRQQGAKRRKKMSKTSVLLISCFGLLSVSFVALLLSASMR